MYSRNRAGPYTRAKVTGLNPKTPFQAAARASFRTAGKRWSATLTDTLRAGWMALAARQPKHDQLGNQYQQTGLALYADRFTTATLIVQPTFDTAPQPQAVTDPQGITTAFASSSTGQVYIIPAAAHAATEAAIIRATRPLNPARYNFTKYLRVLLIN